MSESVLLCTVGGSHQPILEAIRSTKPSHTCFFCTGRDVVTDRPGSVTQVTGSGSVIKARREDGQPSLPNLPTQAQLDKSCFDVVEVSADDLDQAFFAMRKAIDDLSRRFPDARFVADYTGGTKTMTAALVCVALESDGVELQLVAGARSGLGKVDDRYREGHGRKRGAAPSRPSHGAPPCRLGPVCLSRSGMRTRRNPD